MRAKLWRTICGTMLAAAVSAVYVSPPPPAMASPVSEKAETAIEWHVKPDSVEIFLDDKKLGEAGTTKLTKTTPGKHTIRLKNGEDETEMDISVEKGKVLKFTFEFEG